MQQKFVMYRALQIKRHATAEKQKICEISSELLGQHMLSIEVWNELGVIRPPHLHEAFRDAKFSRMPYNLLILKRRQRTVNLRMPASLVDGHVLIHD